mmetsp:Transcript_36875/g.89881  ORF Transcript_36875/g.89881 Transcript_36875/m.89881 type:complete len:229 (+) Transcript_36875:318-1004(+)
MRGERPRRSSSCAMRTRTRRPQGLVGARRASLGMPLVCRLPTCKTRCGARKTRRMCRPEGPQALRSLRPAAPRLSTRLLPGCGGEAAARRTRWTFGSCKRPFGVAGRLGGGGGRGAPRRNVYSRPVGAQCGGMPRCCSREASGWTWRDGRNERTDYWNPGGQAVVDNVVDNRKTQGAHVSAAMIPFSERLGQWLNTLPPYVCVLSLILIIGALHLDGIQCLIERVTGE